MIDHRLLFAGGNTGKASETGLISSSRSARLRKPMINHVRRGEPKIVNHEHMDVSVAGGGPAPPS
jgi:hypothetical protein